MTNHSHHEAPIRRAVPNEQHPGCFLVYVECPLCGKEHMHGVAGGLGALGDRGSHCLPMRSGGYMLTDPDGVFATLLAVLETDPDAHLAAWPPRYVPKSLR